MNCAERNCLRIYAFMIVNAGVARPNIQRTHKEFFTLGWLHRKQWTHKRQCNEPTSHIPATALRTLNRRRRWHRRQRPLKAVKNKWVIKGTNVHEHMSMCAYKCVRWCSAIHTCVHMYMCDILFSVTDTPARGSLHARQTILILTIHFGGAPSGHAAKKCRAANKSAEICERQQAPRIEVKRNYHKCHNWRLTLSLLLLLPCCCGWQLPMPVANTMCTCACMCVCLRV